MALSEYDEQSAYQIVNGIYHTVVSRDIVKRHRINKQDLFDRVVKYIIENMGKTFSANSISTFLKSEHRKVSVESIYNYLRWLEQAFIIYPCERYDLQGKSILKTQEKYYLSDVSLKYALLGYNRKMLDGAMENIVFLAVTMFSSARMIQRKSTLWPHAAMSESMCRSVSGFRRLLTARSET